MSERPRTKETVIALTAAALLGVAAFKGYNTHQAAGIEREQTEQAELLEASDRFTDTALDGLEAENVTVTTYKTEDGLVSGRMNHERINPDFQVLISSGETPGSGDIWLTINDKGRYTNGYGTPVDVSVSVRYTSSSLNLEADSLLSVGDIREMVSTADITRVDTLNTPVDKSHLSEISLSSAEISTETGMIEPMINSISVSGLTKKINQVVDSN